MTVITRWNIEKTAIVIVLSIVQIAIVGFLSIGIYSIVLTLQNLSVKTFSNIVSIFIYPGGIFVAILVIGVIINSIGCFGILRENVNFMRIFLICLKVLLAILVFLLIFVALYVFIPQVSIYLNQQHIGSKMSFIIIKYKDDINLAGVIDSIQATVKCCGFDSPEDWDINIYFNQNITNLAPERGGVPYSCCKNYTGNINCGNGLRINGQVTKYYQTGCLRAFKLFFFKYKYYIVGIIGGYTFLVLMFLVLVDHAAITCLKNSHRRNYY